MTEVHLRITHAGPLVSLQDAGRFGHMRFGVPASGPMDRMAHCAANVALGNPAETTAVEISLGGLALECVSGAVTLAVTGGGFSVEHDGRRKPAWSAFTLGAGERMSVNAGPWGSWAYLAFAGSIDSRRWLGSTATHSLSGFGGGLLATGQELRITGARTSEDREGRIPVPGISGPLRQARVVLGPQQRHFEEQATTTLTASSYALSSAYDRMGVRLDGPGLPLRGALSIPSEPIVRGSIQVAGDGVPTVLLADHQTTGGYPKIATVVSSDLDQLTQLRAGESLRFESVSPHEAVAVARQRQQVASEYLEAIATPGRSFAHRLYGTNLIGGVVSVHETDDGG